MKTQFSKKIFAFVLSVLVLGTSIVNADTLGGKWITNPSYYVSSSFSYYTQVVNGISYWNSSLSTIGASRRFVTGTPTGSTIGFSVIDSSKVGWDGQAVLLPNPTSTYTGATVRFNDFYIVGYEYGSSKIQSVATHEFGHVLGLAHPSDENDISIMVSDTMTRYDDWGLTQPTSYDNDELEY